MLPRGTADSEEFDDASTIGGRHGEMNMGVLSCRRSLDLRPSAHAHEQNLDVHECADARRETRGRRSLTGQLDSIIQGLGLRAGSNSVLELWGGGRREGSPAIRTDRGRPSFTRTRQGAAALTVKTLARLGRTFFPLRPFSGDAWANAIS